MCVVISLLLRYLMSEVTDPKLEIAFQAKTVM